MPADAAPMVAPGAANSYWFAMLKASARNSRNLEFGKEEVFLQSRIARQITPTEIQAAISYGPTDW